MQLKNSLSRFFPAYAGPGWSQRLIFVALALLIAVVELVSLFFSNTEVTNLWVLLTLVFLLGSCGWFAPWSEILYVAAFDIILFTPLGSHLPYMVLGTFAITLSWMARSWIIQDW